MSLETYLQVEGGGGSPEQAVPGVERHFQGLGKPLEN